MVGMLVCEARDEVVAIASQVHVEGVVVATVNQVVGAVVTVMVATESGVRVVLVSCIGSGSWWLKCCGWWRKLGCRGRHGVL